MPNCCQVDPFYRLCWEDGSTFDYVNDQAELDRQIAARNPRRRRRLPPLPRLFGGGVRGGLCPARRCAVPLLLSDGAGRAAARAAAGVAQRLRHRRALHRRRAPAPGVLFHSLLVGGNPFATSSIYTLIHALERRWGVWFPRGGTGALVRGLVRRFEDLGGTVAAQRAGRANRDRGGRAVGVATADGWHGRFDAVASNADVVHTYADFCDDNPRGAADGDKPCAASGSACRCSCVFRPAPAPQPELPHHTVLFGPRYRELIDDIFNRETLAEDFSLYLHAPCATDPSLAPPGAGSFYVLAPVPHLGNAPIDWDVEGPKFRDRILDYLEARIIPGLRADLRDEPDLHAVRFPRRTERPPWLGLLARTDPDAERLVPAAQSRRCNPEPVFRRAGTHPGAGVPGRRRLRQGHRRADAGRCGAAAVSDPRPANLCPAPGLVARSEATIAAGSKSFAVSARLFAPVTRESAVLLYAWCRHCDDLIDGQHLGRGTGDRPATPWVILARLRDQTRAVLRGETPTDPAFAAVAAVVAPAPDTGGLRARAPRRVRDGR